MGLALADQAMVGGANFLAVMIVGRYGGAEELGFFALALTLVYLAQSAQESLVTVPYTIRINRLPSARRAVYRGSTVACHVVLAFAFAALAACAGGVLNLTETSPALGASLTTLALVLPAWLLRELARRFSFADLQFLPALSVSTAVAVLQVAILALLAVEERLTASTALLGLAAANGAAGLAWLGLVQRTLRFSRRQLVCDVRRKWRLGKWIFASQALSTAAMQAAPWILAASLGAAATGVFAACASIIRLANPAIVALINVLTPQAAQAYTAGGAAQLRRVVRGTSLLIGGLMTVFCGGLLFAGEPLLRLFFGDAYVGFGLTLLVLAVAHMLGRLAVAPAHGLMVLHRAAACLKADGVGYLVLLAAVAMLVNVAGVLGAAVGMLLGTAVNAALMAQLYLAADREEAEREAADPDHPPKNESSPRQAAQSPVAVQPENAMETV
jgi:O-antigen/teichoic acid export membrane protein